MKEIKYKYAYDADQNKKLVSIDDVVNNSIRDHSFFCINCGQELIPAIGKTNVPHFKHKTNVKCDGESYLHKLAKLRIHDLFYDFTKPFNIKFTRAICKKKEEQSCPAFTSLCTKHKITTFDLHEYYNVCDIEKKIHIEKNGNNSFCNFVKEDDSQTYIPDLLLTKEGSLNNPILIEIWNKHKSSDEKIKTGLRIIEIKIFSEEDIDSICKNGIVEREDDFYESNRDSKEYRCYFYNFRKPHTTVECGYLTRIVYFNSGSILCPNYDIDDIRKCDEIYKIFSDKSEKEFNISNIGYDAYEVGLVHLKDIGYNVKNCHLCKYYQFVSGMYDSGHICCLYKKYGTPRYPKQTYAINCNYYREDEKMIDQIKSYIKDITIIEIK